jgi:hypothetical protein
MHNVKGLLGLLVVTALACGGGSGGSRKAKNGQNDAPAAPAAPAPARGTLAPERAPWCFVHAKNNTEIQVVRDLSGSRVEGGFLRFDDSKRGRVEVPITGGTGSKKGLRLEAQSPSGTPLPVEITLSIQRKMLSVYGKEFAGDLQNIACSDLD